MDHLIWQDIILGFMWAQGSVIREKIENLALKSGFEAVLDIKLIRLTKYAP